MNNAGDRRHAAQVDVAISLVLFAVGGVGAWSLTGNRILYDFDYGSDPGPGLVPALLLAVLALCALALLAWSVFRLWQLRGIGGKPSDTPGAKLLILPALMIVALVVYALTLVDLGFLGTTITFTAIWCVLIGLQQDGKPTWGRLALYGAEAIAVTGGIYLVFAKLILVPLP
jgi:hypothetical protein